MDAGWRGWPVARCHPILDPLRGDERFKKLMARNDSSVAEMRRKAGAHQEPRGASARLSPADGGGVMSNAPDEGVLGFARNPVCTPHSS